MTSKTRAIGTRQTLTIGNYFEVVNTFKYLGISIDSKNSEAFEVKRRSRPRLRRTKLIRTQSLLGTRIEPCH